VASPSWCPRLEPPQIPFSPASAAPTSARPASTGLAGSTSSPMSAGERLLVKTAPPQSRRAPRRSGRGPCRKALDLHAAVGIVERRRELDHRSHSVRHRRAEHPGVQVAVGGLRIDLAATETLEADVSSGWSGPNWPPSAESTASAARKSSRPRPAPAVRAADLLLAP